MIHKTWKELREEASELLIEKKIALMSEEALINNKRIKLKIAAHNLMSQGPWQSLGIIIEKILHDVIVKNLWEDRQDECYDYTYNMDLRESIETIKRLTNGFFDSFEKEVEDIYIEYFIEMIVKHSEKEAHNVRYKNKIFKE